MITVIILAAGNGQRMNLGYNKMLYKLNDEEIYKKTLKAFKGFSHIILVVNKDDEIDEPNIKKVVGGSSRAESVYNALKEVQTPYVLIHDGARPFISDALIERAQKACYEHEAFGVGVKPKNTIRQLMPIKTLNRDNLVEMQTPQGGKTSLFLECYQKALDNNYTATDDLSVVEEYSQAQIKIIDGEYGNIKITTPEDLTDLRIGHSWDVHQLIENRELILCGIKVPYEKGLLGHSDADVVLHAISEAILGALALGDLGKFFPDNDPQNKDLDSKIIVKKIYEIMDSIGYEISNLDVMIYAEKPKLAPFIDDFRESVASLLKTKINNVSIKATTYEKLGEIGAERAIASEAVVLLKKK